jgi:hypothetical protein
MSSTIGKVSPTIGKIVCRRIIILFNKIAIVSDHGRKGFADCFCLSANGFVSPTIVFVSSLTAGRLRQCFCLSANGFVPSPMFLSLRQRFHVFDHCLYLFANGRASPTIGFVSSTMVVMPPTMVGVSATVTVDQSSCRLNVNILTSFHLGNKLKPDHIIRI